MNRNVSLLQRICTSFAHIREKKKIMDLEWIIIIVCAVVVASSAVFKNTVITPCRLFDSVVAAVGNLFLFVLRGTQPEGLLLLLARHARDKSSD